MPGSHPPPPERVSFHDHIARNKRATVFVYAFMLLLLFGLVFAIGYVSGAPPVFTGVLALAITVGYLYFATRRGVQTVINASGARPANPNVRQEKLLIYKVEEMAVAAGLPTPKVYVQDSKDINAFAAGLKPEEALICVTTGALEQLTQEEMEGVLAHEMAHVANHDMRLATITVAIVGAIAMIAEIGWHLMRASRGRGGGQRGGGGGILILIAIVGILLAPILSRLTYLFLSRRREYLADATGAKLTRNPEGLAGALEKILKDVPDDPKGSRTVAGLYFANPWTRKSFNTVFSTHPPLEERIRRLRAM